MIKAKLADGTTLTFPAGTDMSVIQSTVKKYLAEGAAVPPGIGPQPNAAVPRLEQDTPPPTPDQPVYTAPGGGEDYTAETPITPPPSDALIREVPQVVGGIAGGLAAGAAGPPGWLALAGAIGLGAAGGESMYQLGQHLVGDPNAPKSSVEAARRIGYAGIEEMAWDTFGGLVARGFAKLLKPVGNKITEGASEIREFFKGQIKPVVLLPSEATESRVLDLLANISESSLIGGNVISEFKRNRQKFFDDFADSLIDQFGERTDPHDLGNLFVTAIDNKKAVHRRVSDILYNNVAELIGPPKQVTRKVTRMVDTGLVGANGKPIKRQITEDVVEEVHPVNIPTKPLKDFVRPMQKVARDVGSIEAKNAGDDLVNAIMDLPDTLNFQAAKELRTRLIARANEFQVINKKAPAIGKAKKLANMIDQEMAEQLRGLSAKPTITPKDEEILEMFWEGRDGDAFDLMIESGYDKKFARKVQNKYIKGYTDWDEAPPDELMEELKRMISRADVSPKNPEVPKAAIRDPKTGKVYTGDSHVDAIESMKDDIGEVDYDSITADNYGFTLEDGKFVTSDEAKEIYGSGEMDTIRSKFEQVPALDSTQDAIEFGQRANKAQIQELKDLREWSKGQYDKLKEAGDLQGAMDVATQSQFYREALEAAEGKLRKRSTVSQTPYEAWRIANRFYKEGQEKYNSALIRRLVKLADDTGTGAEMIAPNIFKPGRVSTVQKIKKAVDPTTWRKLQGFFMEHFLNKSTDTMGAVSGKKMVNNISGKPGSFGEPMLREILTPQQLQSLKTFSKAVQMAQDRQAEGAGRMLIQLTQAGGALALLQGNMDRMAATVIFAPPVIARMMLSPRLNRLMIDGISTPARSPEAAGIAARLMAATKRVKDHMDEDSDSDIPATGTDGR